MSKPDCLCKKISVPVLLFLLAFASALPLVFLQDIPLRDAAMRYAPAADAFARLDFLHAFHPRIGFILPFVSGIIALVTGASGFLAVKLASALFSALSLFPLYGLAKRVFSERCAVITSLLFIFCSEIGKLAGSGLREPAKTLAFLLAVWALERIRSERARYAPYLWMSVSLMLLISSRSDCSLYALAFFAAAAVFELTGLRSIRRSAAMTAAALVLMVPALAVNAALTGYPVPETRHALILRKIEARTGLTLHFPGRPVANPDVRHIMHIPLRNPGLEAVYPGGNESVFKEAADLFVNFFKGSCPLFFLPALLGIALSVRRKHWNRGETLILWSLIGHHVLLILQLFLAEGKLDFSPRYIVTVAPLWFGWTAWFVLAVYDGCRNRFPAKYVNAGAAVLGAALAVLGMILTVSDCGRWDRSGRDKRQFLFHASEIIRSDYAGKPQAFPPDERLFTLHFYVPNRRPVILTEGRFAELGWMAGGETVQDYLIPVQQIPFLDYFVTDLPEEYSQAEKAGKLIRIGTGVCRGRQVVIYRFSKNKTRTQ